MNVVILGDIGWQYLYHLGDEAMTEAAIDMLRDRGVDEITLVAAQPAVAEAFYGLPCVTRVGFKSTWSRAGNNGHLSRLTDTLAGEIPEGTIFSAIRDCDSVLIAGGGNMNSRDYHLLYERLAAKRIAEHFGKPLYVTSQTVGPMLSEEDRDRVVEIADYALAFGCREATTAALVRQHVSHATRVHHTLDDATVLTADPRSRAAVGQLAGNKPFVVASFTNHPGTIWPDDATYYADIANACASIAGENDVDILLAPHAGSLDPSQTSRDQDSNEIIASLAATDRVRATRMITAREDVALIEASALSLSTRYHPTIFGPAAATPTIGIAPSYYSSVRMRGSMRNVGLERFVLPTSSMHLLGEAAAEAIAKDRSLSTFLDTTRERTHAFQHGWWNALAAAMVVAGEVDFADTLSPGMFLPQGDWSVTNETILPVFDDYAQSIDRSGVLAAELDTQRAANAQLTTALNASQEAIARYKSRKVVRVANWLGRLQPGR
jgi:polysaccharide pyruvyl transferase WcaK-like protein